MTPATAPDRDAFTDWLNVAKPGCSFIYQSGSFAVDENHERMVLGRRRPKHGRLQALRTTVHASLASRAVDLLQRKLGEGVYEYIAVRRRR